jgi:hypothetical protein
LLSRGERAATQIQRQRGTHFLLFGCEWERAAKSRLLRCFNATTGAYLFAACII